MLSSRRASLRRWRRTRPFWGGLLMILAGVELLMIPLSGILLHGAIKLVVYIGIGGVFGVLIGALLVVCGLLLWLNPVHRTFYAIAGVVLAVLSFIASNFGGFFIGMLLGITGGSMGFGWTPRQEPVGGHRSRKLRIWSRFWPRDGGRMLASAAMPILLTGVALPAQAHASHSQQASHSRQDCILGILCWPNPSPSPTTSAPAPTSSSGTGASSGSAQNPSSSPTASTGISTGSKAGSKPGNKAKNKKATANAGLEASTATSVITAGSATLDGLSYRGTAQVPTSTGTQTMMKFTMTSLTLSGGVTASVTQNGHTTVTTNSSLVFTGGVVLYATKLSGSLLGVPVTLTPGNVITILLQALNSLTPAVPVTMTNITTDQALVLSGALQANDLNISS